MTALRPHNASSRRTTAFALGLALLLSGCVTPPAGTERGILASARRVLAIDFGRAGTARHTRDISLVPAAIASEFRRTRNLVPKPTVASRELGRTKALVDDSEALLIADLKRHPRHLHRFVPKSSHISQGIANMFDHARVLLGPGQRPLNEIDDYVHRTHHADVRPEKTLWQRILRRLDL